MTFYSIFFFVYVVFQRSNGWRSMSRQDLEILGHPRDIWRSPDRVTVAVMMYALNLEIKL